jgi:hypothetical protein
VAEDLAAVGNPTKNGGNPTPKTSRAQAEPIGLAGAIELLNQAGRRGVTFNRGDRCFWFIMFPQSDNDPDGDWKELCCAIHAHNDEVLSALSYHIVWVEQLALAVERLYGHGPEDSLEIVGYTRGFTGLREYYRAVSGKAKAH